MRLGAFIDPIAEFLLGLRRVSATHWLLRLVGIAAMLLALVGTLPSGLFVHIGTGIITLAVMGSLLVQALRPDSDVGLLAPAAIILTLAGQGDLSLLRAAGVGLALLLSHVAFALAATLPAHGVFERSAWILGGRGLLLVLAVSVLAGLLVVALSGVHVGSWMLVIGILGAIGLFVTVMPRST